MNKIIILTGPTAVGKTALSVKLAKKIDGEIISCDSMQVYKRMDIGSAKVSKEEMDGVKHHLIDILEPDEEFNVYVFKQYAKEALNEIYANNHIPILVGGTGFYIQALLYDIDFKEEDNSVIRKELENEASLNGSAYMYEKLIAVDPDYAKTLHPNNVKKIIRALEYISLNGQLFSEHNNVEKSKKSPYDFRYFVLNDERQRLYNNIELRVDKMIDMGLVDEVRALYDNGYTKNMVSMQGLGYKELFDYYDGLCTLDEAIYNIKIRTRHFAKRQLTWFRGQEDVIFVNKQDYLYDDEKILEYMLEVISNE